MKTLIRVLITLLGLVGTLLFVALVTLNADPTRVQLGVFDIPAYPIGRLLAGALGAGSILGVVVSAPFLARSAGARRRLTRQVTELDQEVRDLRTLPLRGDG